MQDHSIHLRRFLLLVLLLCGASRADRTLMWLPDWYGGNLDSVNITSVYVPHWGDTGVAKNGYYYGTKDLQLSRSTAYARGTLVNRKVADSLKVPRELSRWWYAMPNYAPGNFKDNRFEVKVKFNSWNHSVWNPPVISLSSGTGEGGTGAEFNRDNDPKLGLINQCTFDYPNDSLWIYNPAIPNLYTPRYNHAIDTVINQGYVGNGTLVCSDHNPFFIKVGTVHVYNPWPGNSLWIQQGGAWRPLWPEAGRQGWQTATIWADPRGDTTFKVRIASMKPAPIAPNIQYLDASGFAKNATGPAFDFTASPGSDQWILPPMATGAVPKTVSSAPPVRTVLMIQRPNWNSSAMRVLWKGFAARFIAGASTYCDWFSMPLYEGVIPDEIVLQHPQVDSLFGTNGKVATPADMTTYTGWIVLKDKVTKDTTWLTTQPLFAQLAASKPTSITTCDTKILAFSAYDYAQDSGSTSKYFYAPFAEDKSGVNKPGTTTTSDNCGLTKGLVNQVLNAQGRPEWSGTVGCDIGEEAHGPQHWYDTLWRAASGATSNTRSTGATQVNSFKCLPVTLKLDANDGYYKFSNSNYFPLDLPGTATATPYAPAGGNNFHFAMHAKATFEYVRGLEFKFTGDDDVWIFIDKKLALDLGGQHGPVSSSLNLDKLGLKEGKSYQFDMFYSERHKIGSSMAIQTTMNLVPTLNVEFDSAASSGSVKDVTVKLIETASTDPSVCPENNPTPPTPKVTLVRANIYITAPDGSSEEITDSTKYAKVGLIISKEFSRASIDTAKLKASGLFTQGGTWNIVLAYGSETWSTPFSIVALDVDAQATLYDRDGDGRGDSVFVQGDGATPAFHKAFEGVLRWADASGTADSVRILAASLLPGLGDTTLSATFSPLPLRTACPPNGCSGDMGRIWGISAATSDTVKNQVISLQDGIAPVADSAWLVYDSTGTGKDTLYVRASEPLVRYAGAASLPAATDGWALLGNSAVPRLHTGTGSASGNLLAIPLDPATNSIASTDSVRLGGYAADVLNNAPGAKSVWVPIAAQPRVRAWMLDRNGDGTPDSVVVSSKGSLTQVVSAKVHWKTADGVDTVLTLATPGGITGGLKLPAVTTLQNATACKGCLLEMSNASGALPSVALIDSVAPVAVKATLVTAGTGIADTLEVVVSEGFVVVGKDFVKLATDSAGTQFAIAAGDITSFSVVGKVLRLVVASGALDVSRDWLRLSAGLEDSTGAAVGTSSKWVPLKIRPSGSASLYDADGDGRADSVAFSVRGSVASLGVTEAVLSWKDVDGRTVTRTWSLEGNTGGSFGLRPTDATLRFPFGATSCPGATCTIRLGEVEWPLIDKVAPVALGGSYAFGQGTAPDTLVVKLSETVTSRSTDPTWIEFGAAGTLAGPVVHDAAAVLASGDSAKLIVPVAKAPGLLVDQVRVAAGSAAGELRDVNATVAGSTSPWAPLSYGVAPLAVIVRDPSGQGRPDQVGIRTVRTVPVAALSLDSVSLIWSNAAGTDLEFRGLPLRGTAPDTATQSWSATLPQPLPLGATGCTLSECGAFGFNASGSAPARLVDSAAPVILSARLGYSKPEVARDTLEVRLSEAWAESRLESRPFDQILVPVGTTGQTKTLTNYLGWNLSFDGRTLSLILDTAKSTQLGSGDSAWLSSVLQDASGNHPGAGTRRVPLSIGLRPLQLTIGTWPPVRVNAGDDAWEVPAEGTPQFEILVRPQGSNAPWQTVTNGAFGGAPTNDTGHVTGMLLTLNRPLSGVLYVYDQLGVSVGHIGLGELSKAWSRDSTGKDQVREVWITWNGTNQKNAFAASGVYLLRLVAFVEVDKGRIEMHNLVKKVGWKRK